MYPIGTKLKGRTTEHPGRITILRASKLQYLVEFDGGQHLGKQRSKLSKPVVEQHYSVIRFPKKNS